MSAAVVVPTCRAGLAATSSALGHAATAAGVDGDTLGLGDVGGAIPTEGEPSTTPGGNSSSAGSSPEQDTSATTITSSGNHRGFRSVQPISTSTFTSEGIMGKR